MLGHGGSSAGSYLADPTSHPLTLCCHYPVSKCCSASIAVTGTVRVKGSRKFRNLHAPETNRRKVCFSQTFATSKLLESVYTVIRSYWRYRKVFLLVSILFLAPLYSKESTFLLQSMASELNMHESQVTEYKYEIERLARELQDVKKKYFMQRRREWSTVSSVVWSSYEYCRMLNFRENLIARVSRGSLDSPNKTCQI